MLKNDLKQLKNIHKQLKMYILEFYFTKIVKELLKSRGEYVMKEGGLSKRNQGVLLPTSIVTVFEFFLYISRYDILGIYEFSRLL